MKHKVEHSLSLGNLEEVACDHKGQMSEYCAILECACRAPLLMCLFHGYGPQSRLGHAADLCTAELSPP